MKSKPPFFSANRRLYNKLMPSDISDPAECLENFSRKCKGRIFAKQGSAEAGHPLTEGTQGGGRPVWARRMWLSFFLLEWSQKDALAPGCEWVHGAAGLERVQRRSLKQEEAGKMALGRDLVVRPGRKLIRTSEGKGYRVEG